MSLFNANIAEKIYQGFTGKLFEGTLSRTTTGEYDPITDTQPETVTEHPFEGFIEDYSERLIADGIVNVNDRKILILANSIDVAPNGGDNNNGPDQIRLKEETYTVVPPVKIDPADAVWEVQGRI